MKPYKHVKIRSFDGNSAAYNGELSNYPSPQQQQISPFLTESQFSQYLPEAVPAKSGSSNLLSNINFNQIKNVIDRMGGIDGVISTVKQVQKMVQTFQQFAPVLKMLIPKLGSKSKDDDEEDDYPRRRRRRRSRRRRHRRGYSSSYRRRYAYTSTFSRRSNRVNRRSLKYRTRRR